MAEVLVDTNIVSYRLKGHPLAAAYVQLIQNQTPVISFMTEAELYEGAFRRKWGEAKIARLKLELQTYVTLPYTSSMCELWGRIRADRKLKPIAVDDAWIAATALEYGIPLVTHNPSDFQNIDKLVIITALS